MELEDDKKIAAAKDTKLPATGAARYGAPIYAATGDVADKGEAQPEPVNVAVKLPTPNQLNGYDQWKAEQEPEAYSSKNAVDYLLEARKRYRPLTDDDVRRIRRRQRAEGIIAGISDAARALSNLYFTTQYAPDMYNAQDGMSAKSRQRYERMMADRDKENDAYYNLSMSINKLQARDAADKYQRWRDKRAAALKERDQERKEAWDEWRAEKDRLTLEIRQAQNEGNAQLAREKLEELKRHNGAMEKNGYIRASKGSSGGGRGGVTHHFMGQTYHGNTKDYAKDVYEAASAWNAEHPDDQIATSTSEATAYGTRSKPRKVEEIASDVERRNPRVNRGTMPGVSSRRMMPGVR